KSTTEKYKCFENVEDVTTNESLLKKQDEASFCETDNEIVSILEKALVLLRYCFQLYDTYSKSTLEIDISEVAVMLFSTVCNMKKLFQKVKKYKQQWQFSLDVL
ncbi:hypothetical protein EDC96DRAFT_583467, partial [Choanephora cucurbitarum]